MARKERARKITILITGASGLLGNSLYEYLSVQPELNLRLTSRSIPPWLCTTRCEYYPIDLINGSSVEWLLATVTPDIVIHCAGMTDVDGCERNPKLAYEVNCLSIKNLTKYAPSRSFIVNISSDQVYGNTRTRNEDITHLAPTNYYGITKLIGEDILRSSGLANCNIRTNIVGGHTNRRNHFVDWLVKATDQKVVELYSDYRTSPIHVFQLARIIYSLIKARHVGTLNVGSIDHCTKHQFGNYFFLRLGRRPQAILGSRLAEASRLADRPLDASLDVTKILALGFSLPSWRDSVDRCVYEILRRDPTS